MVVHGLDLVSMGMLTITKISGLLSVKLLLPPSVIIMLGTVIMFGMVTRET
jgi:hypothetical protein